VAACRLPSSAAAANTTKTALLAACTLEEGHYVCRKPTNKQATGPYKWVNQLSKLLVICLPTRTASTNVCGIINQLILVQNKLFNSIFSKDSPKFSLISFTKKLGWGGRGEIVGNFNTSENIIISA
jgi:hypothetical protein